MEWQIPNVDWLIGATGPRPPGVPVNLRSPDHTESEGGVQADHTMGSHKPSDPAVPICTGELPLPWILIAAAQSSSRISRE